MKMYLKALFITILLLAIKYGEGAPLDRNEDHEDFVSETSDELVDHGTQDTKAFSDEERNFDDKKLHSLHSDEKEEDYDSESDVSVYESIRDEKEAILTKIERLYNAFKSQAHQHEHLHEFPLVSIVETEPHSMTIMVKPKQLKPDTMVACLDFE